MENLNGESLESIVDSRFSFLSRQMMYWSQSFIKGEMTQDDVKRKLKKSLKRLSEDHLEEYFYVKLDFTIDGYLKWIYDKKKENPHFCKGLNPYEYIGEYKVKNYGILNFKKEEHPPEVLFLENFIREENE